jgi:hypothetical protein
MIQHKHMFGLLGNNLENNCPQPLDHLYAIQAKAFIASNIAPFHPAQHKNHSPVNGLL